MELLLSLLILLAAARLLGELAVRLKVPALVGEIFAGIVLGPSLLGLLAPDGAIQVLADLGIFFVVFLAALELTLADVKRSIRESGVYIAIGAFTIPALAGTALGGAIGLTPGSAMFLGVALAFTALPVMARILSDLDLLNTHFGRSLISAGLLCDVAGLACVGLLVNLTNPLQTDLWSTAVLLVKFGLFLATIISVDRIFRFRHGALGAWMLRASRHLLAKESAFALPFLVALGFAFLADALGLHFVVGTFFGTLLVSEHVIADSEVRAVRSATSAITLSVFAPVFFAFIGLTFEIRSLTNILLVLAVLSVAAGTKLAGGYVGARWSRFSRRESVAAGIGMNGRGAMELVVATLGLELAFIDQGLFSILVLTGVVTTLMTPFGLRFALRRGTASPYAVEVEPRVDGLNGGG